MSIYRRDEILPEWEPIPWDMNGPKADAQERGYHDRASKPVVWIPIPFKNFPSEGIFGQGAEWFTNLDASHYAECDGEHLILIDNTWHGFPDPPRWGLASKSAIGGWQAWGHFPDLPDAWSFLEKRESAA